MALLLKTNIADGSTNGTAVTITNSLGPGSNNLHAVTGTWTYSNAATLQSGLCYATTGGVATLRWQNLGTTTRWEVDCWWQPVAVNVTSSIFRVAQETAINNWINLEYSGSTNQFRVKGTGGATLGTATQTAAAGTTYRLKMVGDNAAGTAVITIYNAAGTLLDTLNLSAIACPKMFVIDFGPNITSGNAAYFDGLEAWDNDTYAYTPPANGNSQRINVTANAKDYPMIDTSPATSVVFGVWTKPHVVAASPMQSPNHKVFRVTGNFWEVQGVLDNTMANSRVDSLIDNYNANTMLFASKTSGGTLNWADDYTVHYSPTPITATDYAGWKYIAWQVFNDSANSRIILRQWLKYGLAGAVVKHPETIATYATIRTALQTNAAWTAPEAAAWTPDNLIKISIGDNSSNGVRWDYVRNAKVFNRSTEPSLAEIEAMATTFTADNTAWADYELKWASGLPDLTDRSGNGRNLYDPGAIRQGELFTGGQATETPLNGNPFVVWRGW